MIAAVMMVRDEDDIVGHTVFNLIRQGIDRIYVADNLSTDNTRSVLAVYGTMYPDHLVVLEDDEPGYYQDRKMTALAAQAAADGAEWILPCDADEFWYHPDTTVAEFLNGCTGDIIIGRGWDHIVTDDDDPAIASVFARIGHRRLRQQKLPKVAFRWHPDAWIDFGNHDVFNHPGQRVEGLKYRHYQYRSFEQMCRKVRQGKDAYDATDLPDIYGSHWREQGAWDDARLWRKWRQLCEEPGLKYDPAPVR